MSQLTYDENNLQYPGEFRISEIALFNTYGNVVGIATATAEISRTQVWFWLQNGITINNGETFNIETYEKFKHQEIEKIKNYVGENRFNTGKFQKAIQLFDQLVLTEDYQEFLTLEAYKYI